MPRLLVIDNYDSFTYNLVQMFRHYPLDIRVVRADKISRRQAEKFNPDYLLVSPGPRDPEHAGISKPLIKMFLDKIPVLGVCLGMQCINEVFGGRTVRAPVPWHGKTSKVIHGGQGIFTGIPSPFIAARYHSLVVEPHPDVLENDLEITACNEDGLVMALAHRKYPLFGVQFHPESFLTEWGAKMVANFLGYGPLDWMPVNRDPFSVTWHRQAGTVMEPLAAIRLTGGKT